MLSSDDTPLPEAASVDVTPQREESPPAGALQAFTSLTETLGTRLPSRPAGGPTTFVPDANESESGEPSSLTHSTQNYSAMRSLPNDQYRLHLKAKESDL